jgi:hypothetical protein
MRDPLLVGEVQAGRDLRQDRQRFGQGPPAVFALSGPGFDVHPRRVVAHHVGLFAGMHDLADDRDVGMPLAGDPPDLGMQHVQQLLRPAQIGRQPANGHLLARLAVEALPNLPHLARAQNGDDLVAIQQQRPHSEFPGPVIDQARLFRARDFGRLGCHDRGQSVIFPVGRQ